MLYEYIRVLNYDSAASSFTDLSIDNQDDQATLAPFASTGDYLYVGQYWPFNNLFFHAASGNAATGAEWEVQYWDSTQWRDAVDILDATKSSEAVLGRSGVLQWSLHEDYNWFETSNTDETAAPDEMTAGLSGTRQIYNLYWMRLRLTGAPASGLALNEISYAFTNTQELNNFDVEINSFMTAFDSSKTDWIPEILTASKMILSDLRRANLVRTQGQVLRFDDVHLATTYKALALIYMNLGPSYAERKAEMMALAAKELNGNKRLMFDMDKDGKVERAEIVGRPGQLLR